jgi:hypothetical protein
MSRMPGSTGKRRPKPLAWQVLSIGISGFGAGGSRPGSGCLMRVHSPYQGARAGKTGEADSSR